MLDLSFLVVIDAGHQAHGDSSKEPIGSGASQTKDRVTGGTEFRDGIDAQYDN